MEDTQSQLDSSSAVNIQVHDKLRMFAGYNLYDGQLIDAQGVRVKQWNNDFLGTLDDNGDYYAGNFYQKRWGRYTWNDQVIWEKDFPIHHELYLSPKGTIFVLIFDVRIYKGVPVNFDAIGEFDKNGHELQRFNLWDYREQFHSCRSKAEFFDESASLKQKVLVRHALGKHYDYFHVNSFVILPSNQLGVSDQRFRAGNWLISLKHGSMVCILDANTKKILWSMNSENVQGGIQGQHNVSMLSNGNILLFENGIKRQSSRILVIDPVSYKIVWKYQANDFFSEHGGGVQMLPNGNILVTESTKRKAFEITPEKKFVWEFQSGALQQHALYRMTRYSKASIDALLNLDKI